MQSDACSIKTETWQILVAPRSIEFCVGEVRLTAWRGFDDLRLRQAGICRW